MEGLNKKFPVGMRVLLVDHDETSLCILEQMLRQCRYSVTTAKNADAAIHLMDHGRPFDLMIYNIELPESSGFRLLEFVDEQTHLPAVAVASTDTDQEIVAAAVLKGAKGILMKPIRMEYVMYIWQHVVRSKLFDFKQRTDDGDNDGKIRERQVEMETQGAPSDDSSRDQDDHDELSDHSSAETSAKKRFMWTTEMHEKFLDAIGILGPERALPKGIMEIMNVKGVSRQQVTSHLQTYRMNIKKGDVDDDKLQQLSPNGTESPHTNPGHIIDEKHLSLVGSSSTPPDHVEQPSQIMPTKNGGNGRSEMAVFGDTEEGSGLVTETMAKVKPPHAHKKSKQGGNGVASAEITVTAVENSLEGSD